MNREIKFRGISIDEWVYGMLCKVNEGDTEHGEPIKYKIQTDEKEYGEYVKCFITDENTIGQYTGLHDENGKEIYEGDILINDDDEIAVIKYSDTDALFELIIDDVAENFSNESSKWWEVIGNIYDNSDLLK